MPPNRQIGGVGASTLREQWVLNLGKLHRTRTLLIIVRHVIDTGAHGVAPHEPSIAGLQQFGDGTDVLHSGVEPEVVVVRIKNDWHPVVDG